MPVDRKTVLIRRIARIWGTVIVVFALLMFIGYAWSWVTTGEADPYAEDDYPFIENIPPIFLFIAIMGLGIAWRWEGAGGIINLIFCLATLPILLIQWPITREIRFIMPYLLLIMVAIPGILFLVCWHRSRKGTIPQNSA